MKWPHAPGWSARARAGFLVLAFVPSLVPGCAPSPYAAYEDRGDACYAARAPLIGMGNDFQKTVLGATAIGAGAGALGGLALGQATKRGGSDNTLMYMLVGAAAGALAGSLVGYLDAKKKAAQTQGQVLALIDQDAAYDRAHVSGSANAISGLIACRDAQTRQIEADYAAHRTTREQALANFRGVQAHMVEDDKLITTLLGAADEREAKYISARAETMNLPPNAPQAASPATEQLSAARKNAAEQEAAYRRLADTINRHVSEFAAAVG